MRILKHIFRILLARARSLAQPIDGAIIYYWVVNTVKP